MQSAVRPDLRRHYDPAAVSHRHAAPTGDADVAADTITIVAAGQQDAAMAIGAFVAWLTAFGRATHSGFLATRDGSTQAADVVAALAVGTGGRAASQHAGAAASAADVGFADGVADATAVGLVAVLFDLARLNRGRAAAGRVVLAKADEVDTPQSAVAVCAAPELKIAASPQSAAADNDQCGGKRHPA